MARRSLLKRSTVIIVGAAVVLTVVAYGRAREKLADSKTEPEAAATARDTNPPKDNTNTIDTLKGGEKSTASYWIGVQCVAPIPEMVRVHVAAPNDSGVFVADVVPEGPAAKAGIARHDIILSAAGSPLKNVADLTAAVGRSQDKPLTLEILRSGKRQNIEIAPRRRPAGFAAVGSLNLPADSKWHELGIWFDENHPARPAARP